MSSASRHPIVAVMGHIDHGKSSLLDFIRKANVVAGEAGGITQHVSAYVAEHTHEGKKRNITFLDTPGHEAFRALRARGAQTSDVAILVIASDEGVKPQTVEAFKEITEAGIPFVIAFTKIDKNGADIERAKIGTLEAGIYIEGLGGTVPYVGVSSKTGDGIPELLDLVLLTSDLAELTADPALPASGFILESSQDPKRGISATLVIKDGTLQTGTCIVAGNAVAPVRFIEDFTGARIPSAGPSLPVVISGWSTLPSAGSTFVNVANKKEAEKIANEFAIASKSSTAGGSLTSIVDGKKILPIILKADVTGSVEAVRGLLEKQTHERVVLRIISSGIGAVSEGDVKAAHAGGGVVIGFNVNVENSARELADRMQVSIETFSIIYELEKRAGELLVEHSPKMKSEEKLGEFKILKVFSTQGNKQVLGARFLSGSISVGSQLHVTRRELTLDKGKLLNLQQAKSDVSEIHTEGEFGLQVESKTEVAPGDILVTFRIVEN